MTANNGSGVSFGCNKNILELDRGNSSSNCERIILIVMELYTSKCLILCDGNYTKFFGFFCFCFCVLRKVHTRSRPHIDGGERVKAVEPASGPSSISPQSECRVSLSGLGGFSGLPQRAPANGHVTREAVEGPGQQSKVCFQELTVLPPSRSEVGHLGQVATAACRHCGRGPSAEHQEPSSEGLRGQGPG